ncbi:MAG: ribonuclease Z [Gemmatimonadota bacterium]|nr:ribonuclease Z [Gemmatimonadota bacterium]
MTIALRVLGSGTVAPSAARTAPAHWVETGSVRLLLDCGAGTLHRAAAFAVPWQTVTHIALTHFHADHWGELPHYLFALRWGIEPPRAAPLSVIGPAGLRDRLGHLAKGFGDWVLDPGYPVDVREIAPSAPVALADGVALESCATPHTDESLAYAVRAGDHRLVYTGDTGPSAALARWAAGCDLLLAECSLPRDRAIDVHLTPSQAGELAREAKAKCLVLTHFYPPVETVDPARLAAAVFAGPVAAARDGDRFLIGA